MAKLISQFQVQGLTDIQNDVDILKTSYPASQVTTNIVKRINGTDTTYYNSQELLTSFSDTIVNLTAGGSYQLGDIASSISGLDTDLTALATKEISDIVKISLTKQYGVQKVNTNSVTADLTSHLDSVKIKSLVAYTTDNKTVVDSSGQPNLFDLTTGYFASSECCVLDISKSQTDSSTAINPSSFLNPDTLKYSPIKENFDFKVFAPGIWTLQDIPRDMLLDNEEIQLISYQQTIDKIIVELARDDNLVEAIRTQIGTTALESAVTTVVQGIDERLRHLEGQDSGILSGSNPIWYARDPLNNEQIALVRRQLLGLRTEAIDANSHIYTTNVVDSLISAANSSITAVSSVANSVSAGAVWKSDLVTLVGGEASLASHEKALSEKAVVVSINSLKSDLSTTNNKLDNFINTTAPTNYLQKAALRKSVSRASKAAEGYEWLGSTEDEKNYKTAISERAINEKITEIEDNITVLADSSYIASYIQLAEGITEDNTKGITAKDPEYETSGATVGSGWVDPITFKAKKNTPVYSKIAVDQNLASAKEELYHSIDGGDALAHQHAYITTYDGLQKTQSITYNTFDSSSGSVSSVTNNSFVSHAAATKETNHAYNTNVYSKKSVDFLLEAQESVRSALSQYERTAIRNEIAYNVEKLYYNLLYQIAKLSTSQGDNVAPSTDSIRETSSNAENMTNDGPIAALQHTKVDIARIHMAEDLDAITFTAGDLDTSNYVIPTKLASITAGEYDPPLITTDIPSLQYVKNLDKQTRGLARMELMYVKKRHQDRLNLLEQYNFVEEKLEVIINGSTERVTLSQIPMTQKKVSGDTTDTNITTYEYNYNIVELLINGVSYFGHENLWSMGNDKKTITWNSTSAGFKLADVITPVEGKRYITARYRYTRAS